ncbi:MAG: MoaD/ThiS family protein [Bacteroidia bacterium]|nr:MoaD/ThiS family protein [Bacteroidia bacterium]
MGIKIRAFGKLAEITGKSEWEWSGIDQLDELKSRLHADFPGLDSKMYVLAVNRQVVSENINMEEGAEVALLPPFSGG